MPRYKTVKLTQKQIETLLTAIRIPNAVGGFYYKNQGMRRIARRLLEAK